MRRTQSAKKNKDTINIVVSIETHDALENLKLCDRESFNSVINRILEEKKEKN